MGMNPILIDSRIRVVLKFPLRRFLEFSLHWLRTLQYGDCSGDRDRSSRLLFFLSGLVVNFIQALVYLLIRPWPRNFFRMINRIVVEFLWLELVWLVDWWAGMKVDFPSLLQRRSCSYRKMSCRTQIEGLWNNRSGCLGSTAIMKKSSMVLPVIGWSMWFSEYVFLERNWAKDESTLKAGYQQLNDFPKPFWLALFVEVTCLTQAKLLAAQEYASSSAGLPVPRNVLIPRTKGFVTAVNHMRSFVPAIYDITVAIPKSSPPPTMLRLFKGQSSVVHVHIKRCLMRDLPNDDEATVQWCRDAFIAKVQDKLLDKHKAENSFGEQLQDTGRPMKPLLVVCFWSILLILGALKLVHHFSVFSSWKDTTFSGVALAVVAILMQILIQFFQSERSTSEKKARMSSTKR